MDNSNINATNQSEDQKPTAFNQDINQVRSFIQKLKEGIKQKKEQAKNVQQMQALNQTLQSGDKPRGGVNQKLVLIIAVGLFLFFTILLIAASLYKSLGGRNNLPVAQVIPTPGSVTVDTTTNANLSRYATDSAVVKIDQQITELDQQMSTSFGEPQLAFPSLDFDVSFE